MQVCVVEATGNVARFRKEEENAAVDNPSCAGRRRRVGMMASMTNAADIFVGEAIRDNIVRPWMGDRNRSATMAMADMMFYVTAFAPFLWWTSIIRCSRYRTARELLLRNESASYLLSMETLFFSLLWGVAWVALIGWGMVDGMTKRRKEVPTISGTVCRRPFVPPPFLHPLPTKPQHQHKTTNSLNIINPPK